MQSDDIELKKISEFTNLSNKQVLEIGCGSGRLSSFLAQKAGSLIAIDIDEVSLEEARSKVKGVDFRMGSGEFLEFPDDSFDLVFFGFSLHHQQSSITLSEAMRVLAPMGEVLIIEPTEVSEYTKLVSVFENDEPVFIRRAAQAVKSLDMSISKQEKFTVNHYFDNEEVFFNYFISSYGDGTTDERSRNELRKIIGGKISESPIIVEDQCIIILIQGIGDTS